MSDVPETEREKFEAWCLKRWGWEDRFHLGVRADTGTYWNLYVRDAWVTWQARAAIEAAVREQPNPPQGDSAVASEGGSCVNAELLKALRELREAELLDDDDPRLIVARKNTDAAIAKAEAALSTAGAQRRASEQDEPCRINPFSSGVCERGTRSCVVAHSKEQR